jgi:hypothetical protein
MQVAKLDERPITDDQHNIYVIQGEAGKLVNSEQLRSGDG